MPGKAWGEKPVALVVEDREDLLELRLELLNQMGFHAIGAATYADALREFRSTPAIDIVITDIDLGESSPYDRSGLTLAREIKKRRSGLPVVGYSAAFEEGDLNRADWGVFDRHLSKGRSSTDQIRERFGEWRRIALDYRRGWLALARAELKRLQTKYEITDRDVAFFRDLLPELEGASHCAGGGEDGEGVGADELLQRAGYRLCLVPGEAVADGVAPPARTREPVPVWLRQEGDLCVAELAGYPCLYAAGDDEAGATAALLRLMGRYRADFQSSPAVPLAPGLERLRDFLDRLLG
jgi:CheY-like chemotaxis protein